MKVRAQLSSYEDVEFSVTLTAPVNDWRAALKQLAGLKGAAGWYAWPLSGFVGTIEKMIEDLDKTHSDILVKEKSLPEVD